MSVKKFGALLVILIATLVLVFSVGMADNGFTPVEELGEFLYFDEDLSEPSGQSCASCHDPDFGFVDPDKGLPVSEGVILGLFGGRNSPAAAYAMYAPIRYFDEGEGLWIGGQFWDSRATGEVLGDPLADQALGPFLNAVEMANTSKAQVIADVALSEYADLFEQVWGWDAFNDVEAAYDQVALSIAAFERTALFGQFSSKYDCYLQECLMLGGGKDDCATGHGTIASIASAIFSKKEWQGLQLFMGDAMCVACHVVDWTAAEDNFFIPAWSPDGSVPPLFTDFTYDNLGVPKSDHKLLKDAYVDLGLGAVVGESGENGKFKVMTLRNIAQTGPYAHNGYFKKLEDITHFYNTRDVPGVLKKGADWPPPEYPATINVDELGNLGLSDSDEDALVKFMKTLSDGWMP
ncbi:MAG TPA: cytochrome c peroxidase [Anaerolineales bacterium]|nr:cytochrome c peroxidase [Anaerolineales bacterium]